MADYDLPHLPSIVILGICYRVMYKRAAYFQHYRRKKKEKERIGTYLPKNSFIHVILFHVNPQKKTNCVAEKEKSDPMLHGGERLRESRSETVALVDL